MTRSFSLCVALILISNACATAQVEFIGQRMIPGDARDLSGIKGADTLGIPADRLGGMGSAIAYTGHGNIYILASDRGPGDGASDYRCRVHQMEIKVKPGDRETITIRLLSTTLLSDMNGKPLTGSKKPGHARFDPEGIRMGKEGRFFISDEYGPIVAEFSPEGRMIRKLPVPARFLAGKESDNPQGELPPANYRGRQPNRGMEGLAVSADGKTLFGIMQSPLIQDGALDEKGQRNGLHCRLLALDTQTGATREFAYRLEDPSHGINEILAVGPDAFLVIERDGQQGLEAKAKRVYWASLAGATDISGIEKLPARELPPPIVPITKRLLIDLLAPRLGLAGRSFPEKIEGLAFGPDLADGRKLLLVTADNDFVAEIPFRIYAFAVPKDFLPMRPQN